MIYVDVTYNAVSDYILEASSHISGANSVGILSVIIEPRSKVTYGIDATGITSPFIGYNYTYSINAYYFTNDTSLPNSIIDQMNRSSNVEVVLNGSVIGVFHPLNNNIMINFALNFSKAQAYQLIFTVNYSGQSYHSIMSVQVQSLKSFSSGLQIHITGSNKIKYNTINTYYIFIQSVSPTGQVVSLSLIQTYSILQNMSLNVYENGIYQHTTSIKVVSSGEYSFVFSSAKNNSYELDLSVKSTTINGLKVSDNTVYAISVVS
jgi:hypothetical protein